MQTTIRRALSVTFTLLLAGCGSGSDSGTTSNGDNTPSGNTASSAGRLVLLDPTRSNAVTPISNLQYWNAGNVSDANGNFTLPSGTTLQLYVGNQAPLAVPATTSVTQQNIASAICSQNADPTACTYNVAKNLEHFFLSLDSDHNSTNGIQLSLIATSLNMAWTVSPDQFASNLAQQLSAYGQTPSPIRANLVPYPLD
ncbi:MAG: hypothetical protein BWK73_46075 [Thiothrix lacustris]|uniref:Uncharacterized protein n=1 Tax=Thiothrix lacustris TaxID=525917 RepID=A0A1Y1QAI3_9GAMM|nr:MAG: hypothetical protein BWK73_46075 [Thiothrix lacustris]